MVSRKLKVQCGAALGSRCVAYIMRCVVAVIDRELIKRFSMHVHKSLHLIKAKRSDESRAMKKRARFSEAKHQRIFLLLYVLNMLRRAHKSGKNNT